MFSIIRLIKRAQKGDREAFLKIFQPYEGEIYRIAFIYLKNKDDALDVVQETAYRAFKSIISLREPKYFKTWLISIAIRCALDIIRSQKKITLIENYDVVESQVSKQDIDDNIPNSVTIKDLIEKLSLDEKNVIILRFYNSCTIQEVADILNIPLGTAKTILYRALKKLQKEWKGDGVCEQ